MPIEKQHVVKVDSAAQEVAIQDRTSDPGSPVSGQLWFNSTAKKLVAHTGGQDYNVNIRALVADPVLPIEGERWINTTTGTLKYRKSGITYSVDMQVSTGSMVPAGDLYKTLTEVELGLLMASGVLYPNALIDAFNETNNTAVMSNVHASGNALRLVDGQNSGNAQYQLETSTLARVVQGVVVITPTGIKPLTTVDNGDGTTTLTIAGDVTGLFAIGKKVLIYKEIQTDNETRSIYVTNPIDNFPSVMAVVAPAPSFSEGTQSTTVKISNNGVNVLTQLGVAQDQIIMLPHDVKIESGADGISHINETKLVDAHGLQDLRALGGDAFRKITSDIPVGTISKCRVQQSANKQYTLIAMIHVRPNDIQEMIFYYSNDSMATINRMYGTFSIWEGGNSGLGQDETQGYERFLNDQTMLVNDDGRFMLAHPWLTNDGSWWAFKLAHGDLNDASPTLIYFKDFGGGPGVPHYTTPGVYITPLAIVPDDTWDYVYVCMGTAQYPAAQSGYDVWYRNSGDTFIGHSNSFTSRWNNSQFHGRWYNNLEGEKQLVFIGQTWVDGYTSIRKKRLSEVLAGAYDVNNVGTWAAFETKPGLDGETRQNILSTDQGVLQAASLDDDAIRFIYWNLTRNTTEYGQINLAGVTAGANEIQHIAFSSQPASGQWSINFNGQTTTTLGFSATAAQIQAALRALSTINGPYVNVTGNYISGFDVEFISTMGLQNQPLMTFVTNTLQNITPAAVTINFTTPQPGFLPIPPTFNAAGFRYQGTGDRVQLMLMRASESAYEGFSSKPYEGSMVAATRRMKKDPANPNRIFFAMQRDNNISGTSFSDANIIQIDNTDTFEGMFFDNYIGTNNANALLRDFTDTYSGDKHAQLITADRTTTLRAVSIRIEGGWNTSPTMPNGFRTRDMALRAKIVGIDTGGLPDETNVLAVSPTKHPLADIPQSNVVADIHFRFDLSITNGQQFFLLIYTENFLASVDWPYGQQGTNLNYLGSTANTQLGVAYYRNGNWTMNTSYGIYFKLFDHFIEPIRTPDTFKYSRMDLHQGVNTYYSGYWNVQVEYKNSSRLLFTYEYGGVGYNDINTQWDKKIAAREMEIQPVGTFLADVNSPATQFPGYDPDKFDPNLIFQTRLGDPSQQQYSKWGNLRSSFGSPAHNPNFPVRLIDWAGGSLFTWNNDYFFELNNSAYGQTPDARFKSGWCIRFGANGFIENYQGSYGCLKADNFALEIEIVPEGNDVTAQKMFWSQYNGNGWYAGLVDNGKPYIYIENNFGSVLADPVTRSAERLEANKYYRIRFTRGDDQAMRIFIWENPSEGWRETQYEQQAYMNNQYLINYDLYMFIGGRFNNTFLWTGKIGEVRMAIGTTEFKNEDLVDQRSFYGHTNLGDRIIAKRYISNGQDADGSGDDNLNANADVNVITPQRQQGIYATRDQMLVYRDLHIPEGKNLAAKVSLSRVSAQDQTAIQGFLLNYSRLPR